MVPTNVVDLYPSIPNDAGLVGLDNHVNKKISTYGLIRMAEFVFTNNHFKFNVQTNTSIHMYIFGPT